MHARKRFGQHFLHDPAVIERIVAAIAPLPGEKMVEIGPGRGAMTLPLLQITGELTVVEIDRDLPAILEQLCAGAGRLDIINADALRFDFAALAGGEPLRIAGNLPYNISSPLLFHLLAQSHCLRDMHFMLQQEVVDRLAAGPGSGTYGRLSVSVAVRAEVEKLFSVGPGAFNPPPRVWSAVVRIRPRGELPSAEILASLDTLLVKAFSQRRKTLRNALKGVAGESDFSACGIDPSLRPENISPPQFLALAEAVAGQA